MKYFNYSWIRIMKTATKKVLITGSNGFIGSNLRDYLQDFGDYDIYEFNRKNLLSELPNMVEKVDLILHLAGVNRPKNIDDFTEDNIKEWIEEHDRQI